MNAWLAILAVGLGSYLFRVSFVAIADRIAMPALMERASELIAPGSFAALAATGIVTTCAAAAPLGALPPLLAAAVAVAAVHRTGSSYAAVLIGMPTLWLATAVLAWAR
jgi:branched-subunit amino acid transport protein